MTAERYMIEVMQAFEKGKRIEQVELDSLLIWKPFAGKWNWEKYSFRIAPEPEPKKEGRWERVEIIVTGDSLYMFRCLHHDNVLVSLPNAARYPGFGGIDYRSPFDEKVIVRSMVPVMFRESSKTAFVICEQTESCRPGIPVAAWFWREE